MAKGRPEMQPLPRTEPFRWRTRVYFADTDAGGVMHHASYVRLLEAARTEWLVSLGLVQRELALETKVLFAISRIELDYVAPARLDDEIEILTSVRGLRRASMQIEQAVWCDGRHLLDAKVWVVAVDGERFRPRPLPPELVAHLRGESASGASAQQQ